MVNKKYFWLTFYQEVKLYIKDYNVCFVSKTVCYKQYGDFLSLLGTIHCWKNLLMNFVICFLILVGKKDESCDSIQVIVDYLTKINQYKPVSITIDVAIVAEIIIDIGIMHYCTLKWIMSAWQFLCISKFWNLLCYIFGIKQKLSIAFTLQTDC